MGRWVVAERLIIVALFVPCRLLRRPAGHAAVLRAAPSSTTTAAPFALEGLPDRRSADACAFAAVVAGALVAGDAETITEASRAADFVCDDETDLPLPGCAPGITLTGHPLIDSRPVIEVLDGEAYAAQNQAILGNVDPSFTDDQGDGAMQVLGVGTCGPDIPERRSYHVAFTAAVTAEDGGTERLVGSYELNLLDGDLADRHRIPRHVRELARDLRLTRCASTAASRCAGELFRYPRGVDS